MLKSIAQKQTTLGAYWHEIIFSTLKSVKHHKYPSQLFCLFYTSESYDGFARAVRNSAEKNFCIGFDVVLFFFLNFIKNPQSPHTKGLGDQGFRLKFRKIQYVQTYAKNCLFSGISNGTLPVEDLL